MIFDQIFDAINIGLVILDKDLKVHKWNRWMEIHSGMAEDKLVGSSVLELFPNLNTPTFKRNCKSVFSFGNFCFFSQKLHHYLFPFKATSYFENLFEYMQQSCAMGPIRDEDNVIKYLFIYVQDATEVAIYERKLLDINLKDGLTGIFNRRYMEIKLKEEFSRAKRYGSPFSLIMFDIDFFKKINDVYGHQCGDFILKSLSSRISSIMRNVDCLYRYGGEEFCCMLPETDIAEAVLAAERFRKSAMEMENNFDGEIIKVTISLGVSSVNDDTPSPERLLKMADDALYKAKKEGRNRVERMS